SVELPNTVELKVVETEPGIRGDTVGSATKPAKLETGLVIQVPLFINEGDIIKVDTRTGKYLERVG
ncbi:MAG TPA: elongation factor P, partial [Thermodesulfobacterium geofontis]|nr:elongation factor P [Thermodesulfobacterium geofontis]